MGKVQALGPIPKYATVTTRQFREYNNVKCLHYRIILNHELRRSSRVHSCLVHKIFYTIIYARQKQINVPTV